MRRLLVLTLNFALLTSLAAAQSFPKPAGAVNDFANIINPATKSELERRIEELEQKTSAEIAVATVQSLDGMSVEEYANRLFKEWGVGQARTDNGVLVPLGMTACLAALNLRGTAGLQMKDLHGTVWRDPADRYYIVPTFHPSYLQRGAMNHLEVVTQDVQLADRISQRGFVRTPTDLVVDPHPDWFACWTDEHLAKVEAGRQLVYHAAFLDAQGIDCTREVSMAKAYCGELVNEVMYDCVQFHGGMGFMRESTIERMSRDARVQAIGGGATEVMLEEVAKRMKR